MKTNHTTVTVTSEHKEQNYRERFFQGTKIYTNNGPEELHDLVSEFEDKCEIYAWDFKLKSLASIGRAYNKIRNRILREFYVENYNDGIDDIKVGWSHKCGCACGCSPGFVVRKKSSGDRLKHNNCNLSLKMEGADPEDVAKLKQVIEKAKAIFIEEVQVGAILSHDIADARKEHNIKIAQEIFNTEREYFNL